MARKKDTDFPLPDDVGHDFEDDHFLLNYKPVIEFVEPDAVLLEDIEVESEPETLDSLRDRTQRLVEGLNAINKLTDLAQKRVDSRVASSGGMTVNLDPVKDGHVIAAMKRLFPDKADPTKLDYQSYKEALDCINNAGPDVPTVTSADIKAAQTDPFKTDFGGLGNQNGENRPEISSPANTIEAVDLEEFQKQAVVALFALMKPLIVAADKASIQDHLVKIPHS
jgi:hypothetical protein